MQQRDRELVEGWYAAEREARGEPIERSASANWREGYDLKVKQLSERRRYQRFVHQPAAVQ